MKELLDEIYTKIIRFTMNTQERPTYIILDIVSYEEIRRNHLRYSYNREMAEDMLFGVKVCVKMGINVPKTVVVK